MMNRKERKKERYPPKPLPPYTRPLSYPLSPSDPSFPLSNPLPPLPTIPHARPSPSPFFYELTLEKLYLPTLLTPLASRAPLFTE